LDIMVKSGQKLSKLIAALPKYYIEKGKIDCPENCKDKVLTRLSKQVKGQNVNTIDGVKIWFPDKSSILIRPSGTEPIYRLYAEARTGQKASRLVQEYSLKVKKILDSL